MKIHILGVAGTFMGGVAQLAKAKGFEVTGSDQAIYPPMSDQLEQAGIAVSALDDLSFLQAEPDQVVIGNALSRGQPAVEAVLNHQQPYTSGPQWLAENILQDRWVVAVAGTHGKTTTAAMVAWILAFAGLEPGFLIGGVPENFGVSARLGKTPFFVVEADEYDSAFFDKRSKFVHYHPRTCVLNNLEFDHADIFADLAAIQTQFHHLVRTVPGNGALIVPQADQALQEVLAMGVWTPVQSTGSCEGSETEASQPDWGYQLLQEDGSAFALSFKGAVIGEVAWSLKGEHNVKNALHAVAAAVHCGVPPKEAVNALNDFKGVKRRLTLLTQAQDTQGVTVYDDFAHHPTAIKTTLAGLRQSLKREFEAEEKMPKNVKIPSPAGTEKAPGRLIAVFEPRSNTMRLGVHRQTLPVAFEDADAVFAYVDPHWDWQLPEEAFQPEVHLENDYQQLLTALQSFIQPQDTVVFMSNGSFGGIAQQFVKSLEKD